MTPRFSMTVSTMTAYLISFSRTESMPERKHQEIADIRATVVTLDKTKLNRTQLKIIKDFYEQYAHATQVKNQAIPADQLLAVNEMKEHNHPRLLRAPLTEAELFIPNFAVFKT